MGGSHSHAEKPAAPRALRFALALIIPAGALIAVGMAVLWPTEPPETDAASSDEVTGEVVGVAPRDCPEDETPVEGEGPEPADEDQRCGLATVELESGEHVVTALPTGNDAPDVDTGDAVVLIYLPDAEPHTYHIVDHDRSFPLWVLAAVFALTIVAFGRWQGLRSLGGLAITFGVLLLFVVPAILAGQSPLLTAIVGAGAIMLTVLYLTHGLNASTTVAVAGTLASLVLTGLLSALAVNFARLTGVTDDETNLLSIYHDVNMQGLLLAGILIGALGALNDVTVTQSNAVAEIARANPNYSRRDLYRSAARIGRAHIGSVVDTLILAYAGASLPLMILIAAADRPLGQVLTTQLISEEIVRSVVGTVGLVAAVPITTGLAALAANRLSGPETKTAPSHPTEPDDDHAGFGDVPPPDDFDKAGGYTGTGEAGGVDKPGRRPKQAKNEWLEMHDRDEPGPG